MSEATISLVELKEGGGYKAVILLRHGFLLMSKKISQKCLFFTVQHWTRGIGHWTRG